MRSLINILRGLGTFDNFKLASLAFVKPARLHFARAARALRARGVLSEFRAARTCSPNQVLTHAARAAAKQLNAREGLWLEQRTCASYWFDNACIYDLDALSSQQDAHVRAARNSDRSPRSVRAECSLAGLTT